MKSKIPGQRTVLALRDALTTAGFALHRYQPEAALGAADTQFAGLRALPDGTYQANLVLDGKACGVHYDRTRRPLGEDDWENFETPQEGDTTRLAARVERALRAISENIVSVTVTDFSTYAGYGNTVTLAVTLRVPQAAVHPPVPADQGLYLSHHPLAGESRTYVYRARQYIGMINHETLRRQAYGVGGLPWGSEQYLHLNPCPLHREDRKVLEDAATWWLNHSRHSSLPAQAPA